MGWSPIPDFSLASALAVLLTLGMIEKTKETDLRITLLLFIFNFYALKIALAIILEAYWPQELKVENRSTDIPPEYDVVSQDDDVTTEDTDELPLEWTNVWTMLGDLTALMARSRFLQLNAEPSSGYMVITGTEKQLKALGLLMINSMKGLDNGAAFLDFIDIEPSYAWIEAVEEFLSPRPTSHKELMFACLDYLNPDSIGCLENAQLNNVWVFNQCLKTMQRVMAHDHPEWRTALLEATQQLVNCATTPQLREDLYITLTARCNGLQPISRSIKLIKEVTPDAVKLFRYKMDQNQLPRFLDSLVDAAEAVMDPDRFDCVMADTGHLLREVQKLTIQNFRQFRKQINDADAEVKLIQRQVVRNWRLLVATRHWSRAAFAQKLSSQGGFDSTLAVNTVEAIHQSYLGAGDFDGPGHWSIPDALKELGYVELVKLNNMIIKQPHMHGRTEEIVAIHGPGDASDPPPFSASN
ncbi:hypothetical protein PG993_007907 [Apiospora rasikravindrae]|uniref:Uncharacterized protein n=1 Tax=Apiospora rasikravindrae TaxID=990691 RepID=A0ABR1SYV3_9PEZI